MLQNMMTEMGHNPSSLSRATNGRTKQPQIFRFLNGDAKEPKRSTWQPVAALYQIPVDAFFDPKAADAAWNEFQQRRHSGWSLPPAEPDGPADIADAVAVLVRKLPPDRRSDVLQLAVKLLAEAVPDSPAR